MDKSSLNLNNLTMDDIDFSSAREGIEQIKKKRKEYQEKYGDDWLEHYMADNPVYSNTDFCEESINRAIYGGYEPCVSGALQFRVKVEYPAKMKRLFGPFYKRYIHHEPNNPVVNKALIKDALKSGKWRELPKELQDEYHRMAGG